MSRVGPSGRLEADCVLKAGMWTKLGHCMWDLG